MVTAGLALPPADTARIEAAIADGETRTSAEFAVAVARSCDAYAPYPLVWAGVLAVIGGGTAAFLLPGLDVRVLFAAQASLFVAGGLLFHWLPLRLLLVPAAVKTHRAQQLARLEFAALVHERTAAETGLLVFVALGERHVEILVDRGIARRIPETAWAATIDRFRAAVDTGGVADALVAAIQDCASILAAQFPPRPGARPSGEIANQVVQL